MESREMIICPECHNLRPKTRQHILGKRYGMTLEGRNKKEECKECQNFFDNTTMDEAKLMAKKDELVPDRELTLNDKTYCLENSKHNISVGNSAILTTGSPIQAISVEAINCPYIIIGSPVSLTFDNSAPKEKDKVTIKNNHNSDLTVYISVIVDKHNNQ